MKLPEVNSERWNYLEDLEGEVWLPTLQQFGKTAFMVSNYGRVKRRAHIHKTPGASRSTFVSARILKNHYSDKGYYRITVFGQKSILVHRLVAEAFLPNPDGLPEVDHINGVSTDNCVTNLRWASHKTNSGNPISRLRNRLDKSETVLRFVPPTNKNRPQSVLEAAFGDSHGIQVAEVVNLLKISVDALGLRDIDVTDNINNFPNFYEFLLICKKFVPPGECLYYLCGGETNSTTMTFAFYLKDKNKKEGTPLILIISHHNKKFKKSTGIIVKPEFFKKQRVRDEEVNKKLRQMENILNEHLNQFSKDEEVSRVLEYAVWMATGKKVSLDNYEKPEAKNPTFYEYFEEYASRDTPQQRQRKNSLKLIRDCMGEKHDWGDVDTAFYFRLIQKLKDKDYSVNYIGSVIKKLKTVMSEGYKLKYHTNSDYHEFKSPTEEASTVWLTPKEVDMLAAVELTDEYEIMARDLFLLGYKTAMRYSDYSRLTLDNIRDNKIYISQKKTAGGVVIPASPIVIKILKKYGGRAPQMHQMVFNRKIKTVGMRAKINEKVLVVKSKGDRHEQEFVEKWTQLSSHCCRRSAITALHLSGVPLHQLMMISGHKDIQSLQRYLRMTKEENAERLKELPFFR